MHCRLTRLLHKLKEEFVFSLNRVVCVVILVLCRMRQNIQSLLLDLVSHPFDPVCFRLQKFELQENVIQI
ncbi:hypothetical protein CEXT_627061 [Caerostris extrusa]|uniref:Uncharacterized protein n=1 Tax=Caerostris extrusa TaxID=172846 RepID=A0AAV4XWD0_CAEEX|nr:hypothetical protein CEXT_627061 [Caerostris extrusa]